MRRIAFGTIAVLVGLLIGMAAGALVTFANYDHDYHVIRVLSWAEITQSVSENKFYARTPDAEKFLKIALAIFQQNADSPFIDSEMRRALRMNCGEFEAQLSELENERGNTDQARSYMAKAQADLKAVGWTDYSKDKIIQVFQGTPSPCATTPNSAAQQSSAHKPCG